MEMSGIVINVKLSWNNVRRRCARSDIQFENRVGQLPYLMSTIWCTCQHAFIRACIHSRMLPQTRPLEQGDAAQIVVADSSGAVSEGRQLCGGFSLLQPGACNKSEQLVEIPCRPQSRKDARSASASLTNCSCPLCLAYALSSELLMYVLPLADACTSFRRQRKQQRRRCWHGWRSRLAAPACFVCWRRLPKKRCQASHIQGA